MSGHLAWFLVGVAFVLGVVVSGLVSSLLSGRREEEEYDDEGDEPREYITWAGRDLMPDDEPDDEEVMPLEAVPGHPQLVTAAGWQPAPTDRVYQWAHREPIRAGKPLTVIDWDALPWAERQALAGWDWQRRMTDWIEDWDRDRLEAA